MKTWFQFDQPAGSVGHRARHLWWLMMPLAGLMAASPARMEKTVETIPNPRISLTNLSGQVVVRGWEKNQVHYLCATASPHVEVDAEALPAVGGPAEKIHFDTHVLEPELSPKEQTTDYSIDVPIGSSLEIHNRQGSVQVENIQGQAYVESIGGSILVKDVAGHLAVRSVGGVVRIERPGGRIEVNSITGNLSFISPSSSQLRASTTSGKITYEGDFVAGGEYAFSDYSGDIEILCPPSASFELTAKTVRGRLENTLRLTPKRHSPFTLSAGNSLLGTHNTGTATLQLTSYSGTIRIHPLP